MTENTNTQEFKKKVQNISKKINEVKNEVHKKIIWQDDLINSILVGLFGKGHILIEWVPGLAKTMTVNTLAKTLDLDFKRIQFTPDLIPADLIGSEIYNPKTWEFNIKKWPIFTNIVLADEINRSPSKVQSALLEAMAEKQVTIWNKTFKLEEPFIVLATQNPIEQAGTFPLPEAQLDRFMMKVDVDYADKDTEKEIYKKLNWDFYDVEIKRILSKQDIFDIWEVLKKIYVSNKIYDYVARIIDASRYPEDYDLDDLEKYIQYGISPRWGISLISAAKVNALLKWRDFVLPEDIKTWAEKTLAHRLVLTYDAIADEVSEKDIIREITENVEVIK